MQRRVEVTYRCFETACQGRLTLEDGADRLFRNVANYQSTLRKISEERRSHLHRGGETCLRHANHEPPESIILVPAGWKVDFSL
jgi:hypothetical protein